MEKKKGRKKITLSKDHVLNVIEEIKIKHGKIKKNILCNELGISFPTLERELERLGIIIENDDDDSSRKIFGEDYEWIDNLLSIDGKKDINMLVCSDLKKDDEVVLFSDSHYGSSNCDLKILRKSFKDHYRKKNRYIIGLGDLIESAIIGSPGVFDQDKFLNSQFYDMVKLLKPLAKEERIIGLHPGNHEFRVRRNSGFSITRFMCELLDCKYLGAGRMHLINYGGKEDYTLYTTHGASGARYNHTKLNACEKLEQICDVELYGMAHTHGLDDRRKAIYGIDKENKTHKIMLKHYILTGSFLDYPDSYAQFKCLPPAAELGSPLLKFKYDEHKIDINYI